MPVNVGAILSGARLRSDAEAEEQIGPGQAIPLLDSRAGFGLFDWK
jgi:hypothetical protein